MSPTSYRTAPPRTLILTIERHRVKRPPAVDLRSSAGAATGVQAQCGLRSAWSCIPETCA